MDAIQIKNLRSIEDTGMVELKPITLLVGANSSGKSTFLRTIPLFKQSLNAKTIGPLLWYGNEVDFGTYFTALRQGESQMDFAFHWNKIEDLEYGPFSYKGVLQDVSILLKLEKGEYDAIINQYEIHIGDNIIIIKNSTSRFFDVSVNGIPHTEYGINHISELPYDRDLLPELFVSAANWSTYLNIDNAIVEPLRSCLRETSLQAYAEKFDMQVYLSWNLSSRTSMVQQLLQELQVEANVDISQLGDEPGIKNFINLFIFTWLRMILYYINLMLTYEFSNSYYIKPFRASAERYYRWQNLAVNTLDSDGNNMAMFVENMYRRKKEKTRFMEWTRQLFGFELNVQNPEGHLSLSIQETEGSAYNIADKGFGYSQILPVILTLWQIFSKAEEQRRESSSRSILVAIEQPELHLHPKLQAKLMDAFVAVINAAKTKNIDLKFLIETHSQTIINRLGLKIARRQYQNTDAAILLFHAIEAEKHSPQIATYDNEGILSNWPIGFFDAE